MAEEAEDAAAVPAAPPVRGASVTPPPPPHLHPEVTEEANGISERLREAEEEERELAEGDRGAVRGAAAGRGGGSGGGGLFSAAAGGGGRPSSMGTVSMNAGFSYIFSAPLVQTPIHEDAEGGDGSFGAGAAGGVGSVSPPPPIASQQSEGEVEDERAHLIPLDEVDYRTELRLLRETLEDSGLRVQLRIAPATSHNFQLLCSKCRVLHFTGHGTRGSVTFEDDVGKLKLIDEATLQSYFTRQDRAPRLVFVSACHSESVAQAFVRAGIPHVITVRQEYEILDKASLRFAHQLYAHLLQGDTVQQSFDEGRRLIMAEHPEEEDKFLLLPADQDHEEQIFDPDTEEGEFEYKSKPLPDSQADSVRDHFLGRAVDVQRVYENMVNKIRLNCITGPAGIGKTQVALRVCEHVRERHFARRIVFLSLEQHPVNTSALMASLAARFGTPEHSTVEETVEEIRRSLSNDDGSSIIAVLLLDGCDLWVREAQEEFASIIRSLVQRVPGLYILVTAEHQVHAQDVGEHPIPIGPLSARNAARLFCLLAPKWRFEPEELLLEACADLFNDSLSAFASTNLIRRLAGNPKVIDLVAQHVHDDTNLIALEDSLLSQIIPDAENVVRNAWNVRQQSLHQAAEQQRRQEQQQQQQHQPAPHGSSGGGGGSGEYAPLAGPGASTGGGGVATGEVSTVSVAAAAAAAVANASPMSMDGTQVLGAAASAGSTASPALQTALADPGAIWNDMVRNAPARSVRMAQSGEAFVSWDTVREYVIAQYRRVLQREAAQRPLSEDDLAFLCSAPKLWGGKPPNGAVGQMVSRNSFDKFWRWFCFQLRNLRATQWWGATNPPRVHLFGREGSEIMLSGREPGTFLLRVSESYATLALSFVTENRGAHGYRSAHVQVEVYENAESPYRVAASQEGSQRFATLRQLVESFPRLRIMHPEVPKEHAFAVHML